MFKKILIAVNDSEQAAWAVDAGIELAKETKAQIALVHVVNLTTSYAPEFGFSLEHLRDDLYESGREILPGMDAKVPTAIHCTRFMREGDSTNQIVQTADDWGADLIVLGTHGRGRLAQFLLGSTAEGVLRLAPCPVMTVRRSLVKPETERLFADSLQQ